MLIDGESLIFQLFVICNEYYDFKVYVSIHLNKVKIIDKERKQWNKSTIDPKFGCFKVINFSSHLIFWLFGYCLVKSPNVMPSRTLFFYSNCYLHSIRQEKYKSHSLTYHFSNIEGIFLASLWDLVAGVDSSLVFPPFF